MDRKTCPCCHQPWPDGKDPASMADNLMTMRLSDLAGGLRDNGATLAAIFQNPVGAETLPMVMDKACSLQAASEMLTEALGIIEGAQTRLGTCPAIESLPAFIEAHGQPSDAGLDGKKIDAGAMRVEWDGETLRFLNSIERAKEDGKWFSTLL